MKISVLFDGASALGASPDLQILETVEAIEEVLRAEGHRMSRIPVYLDGKWIERVRRAAPDLVFNLCEGIDGLAMLEPAVIGVLELLGIPYTGSSSWTTALCLRKAHTNSLLHRAGLPVPPWGVAMRGGPLPSVGFPAICKPAAEDASIGVEQSSVVRTVRELAARVEAMHARWDEVLVQRFVDGREVNVGLLGDEVLPLAEIDFSDLPKECWRIVSYRSKWIEGSDEDLGTRPRCPARLPPGVGRQVKRIAQRAWAVVGGAGYGRVDMRVDASGTPWILEVNANPDIAPDAGLARMARASGRDYADLIRRVCDLAAERRTVEPDEAWALAAQLSGAGAAAVAAADDDERLAVNQS
ncbi:MAG TPA: hypothetical protein VFK13_11890 [Gemmatimonadaceae bacterium]|nr:hypothetical protein [Gemmatimonadaceae bacterium]